MLRRQAEEEPRTEEAMSWNSTCGGDVGNAKDSYLDLTETTPTKTEAAESAEGMGWLLGLHVAVA